MHLAILCFIAYCSVVCNEHIVCLFVCLFVYWFVCLLVASVVWFVLICVLCVLFEWISIFDVDELSSVFDSDSLR
jgi:hypothetical protein